MHDETVAEQFGEEEQDALFLQSSPPDRWGSLPQARVVIRRPGGGVFNGVILAETSICYKVGWTPFGHLGEWFPKAGRLCRVDRVDPL